MDLIYSVEEKINICRYWEKWAKSPNNIYSSDINWMPCSLVLRTGDTSRFDSSSCNYYVCISAKKMFYSDDYWTENGSLSNYVKTYYNSIFDEFYFKNPIISFKLKKIQEQKQINNLFSNTSLKLQEVPTYLSSAIGITIVVIILFLAIKKGLNNIIKKY